MENLALVALVALINLPFAALAASEGETSFVVWWGGLCTASVAAIAVAYVAVAL